MQTNQTEAQQMAAALLAYLNQLEILPVNIALERAEERPAAVLTLALYLFMNVNCVYLVLIGAVCGLIIAEIYERKGDAGHGAS